MRRLTTQDGSVTFRSEKVDEPYHSKSGAREEAFKKYAGPCRIRDRAREGTVRILDFCFGLGYNTAAALDTAFAENPSCGIEVVGLENDDALLQHVRGLVEAESVEAGFTSFPLIRELLRNRTAGGYELRRGAMHLRLVLGDAKETCRALPDGHFHAVFFDPFSPPKDPTLWTQSVFREMRRVMVPGGVLATYSCARSVREAMRAAGFTVMDGPTIGRRGPSTICFVPGDAQAAQAQPLK